MLNLNIVMSIAGRGSRFVDAGYTLPKPLIPVRNKPITETIEKITHKCVFRKVVSFSNALAGHHLPGPSGNYLFTRSSWLKAGRCYAPSLENRTLDSWVFGIRLLGT